MPYQPIPSKCLRCNRSFQLGEVIFGKMPENVWFCEACDAKIDDNNNYTGHYEGWLKLEYQLGTEIDLPDFLIPKT